MSYYATPAWRAQPQDLQSNAGFGFGASSVDVESFVEANTAPVMQAGLQYGQQVLQQELNKSKQAILPMYDHIRLYFSVDHAYVVAKLGFLFFPFISVKHWTTVAPLSSPNPMNSGMHSPTDFGGPSVSFPQSTPQDHNNFSTTGTGVVLAVKHNVNEPMGSVGPPQGAPRHLIPLYNRLAFDLYIPVMAILTYMVLSAFIRGLTHKEVNASSEIFYVILRSLGIRFILEVLLLYGLGMIKMRLICTTLSILDIVALIGYKYVLLSAEVVVLLMIDTTNTAIWVATLYALLACFFFTAKILQGVTPRREGGNAPPLSNVHFFSSAFVVILFQVPQIFWAFSNLFPQKTKWTY